MTHKTCGPAAALFHPDVSLEHVRPFQDAGVKIVIVDDLTDSFSAALVFGGDGTIHRHLRSLIERKTPLLPVPVGSGNDFAAALGIRSIRQALDAWRQFCSDGQNVRTIDVGVIRALRNRADPTQLETRNPKRETLFCNIAGLGLDSEANRLANAMPGWLRANGGYILGALRAILSFRSTVVTVNTASGAEPLISGDAMLVAVANTKSYGSGMQIAPRAELADGLLDLCLVRRMGRGRLLRNFWRVFRGEHLSLPEVEYFQNTQLRIASEQPLDLYADGEWVCQTPLEIEVVPRALSVIVSKD